MRRSWLVWAASTVAFALTVLIVVSTGPLGTTSDMSGQSRGQSRFSARAEDTTIESVRASKLLNGATSQPSTGALADNAQGSDSAQRNSTQGNSAPNVPSNVPARTTAVNTPSSSEAVLSTNKSAVGYQPKEVLQLADPSNYGERFAVDVTGAPASNDFIVVLHETVGSASSALNVFARHNPRDEDQVSYHTLVGLDGTVYYIVPPEQRAFGAGNSSFVTTAGEETVATNPEFPSSVNNFAYHISLETPPDGQNNNYSKHSGYTEAQYRSLAWLLARTTVPDYRITTHKAVDRSGSRSDPRSYEPSRLFSWLHQYPSRAAYSY
ncbi:peptidoglycan recognition family protein [cf. Phormidesmis sp. LEGE 11477]|uniref:peptidoglycan recognition protein family protein n=1 Tax=cf. Phormidesmis sp. LEGE 11477 TaxID=1828680 RepID=UPI00187FE068|nr:peptidoglycan recognition family protein [cf. Phormidesmis sp. LEGE 11477]MBE9063913.1 N-acetylmuramoyl-L-alanine amidase [cf. Phormidesmis sp. LEGE 11477]